jgi:uncharacterized membrane protein YkvA (DUF1232 family)
VNDPSSINMLDRLKTRARKLKREAYAIYIAARDPRTPWYAKALIFFVVAHMFSPLTRSQISFPFWVIWMT